MRRALSCFGSFGALLLSFGCTTGVMVGIDGQGGSTGTHSTGSLGSTSSGSTGTGTGTGTGAACGWDGTPVSNEGGPCGGNLWTHPPTCAAGLTCVQAVPDAVGTCAQPGSNVVGVGQPCGGFVAHPGVCAWNLTCKTSGAPDKGGTCVQPDCSQSTGGSGGSSTGSGGSGTGGSGTGGSGCTNPTVTVDGDGPTKAFDFHCQNAYAGNNPNAAVGYIGVPTPHYMGPELVWIQGCLTNGGAQLAGSLSINAPQAMVGTTMMGNVEYDSGSDSYANTSSTTVTITELGTDTIAGTYSATVQAVNNGVKNISGTFKVCRAPDFLPP
jgi:hypothetical protein